VRAFVAIDARDPAPSPSRAPAHLTIRFLGDVAESRIPAIGAALRPVAERFRPFFVTFEGVGAFPSRAAPRVVWVGVGEGRATVERLAEDVTTALDGVGFPREPGAFVAHLTLFRVRSESDRSRARSLLEGRVPPPEPRRVRVDELVLKESTLGPSGPSHRTVERFPFAGGSEERAD